MFDGVVDWVIKTIELIKNEDGVHLYIKTHPAEQFGPANSRKSVGSFIRQRYPEGIRNVSLLEPNLRLKPYSLFPFIDAAILFQGTLGPELLRSDIPVISCAAASYNGLGFVHEPKNVKEYRDLLISAGKLTYDKDLLNLFLYFYFIKVLRIPWDISDKVNGNTFKNSFNIDSVNDLAPGKSKNLDHLCNIILNKNKFSPESW